MKRKITGLEAISFLGSDGRIHKGSLVFQGDKIAKISSAKGDPSCADGLIAVPGFIDEHIHGAKNHDVMEGTLEALTAISSALPSEGVTSFAPTTMTMEESHILKALKAIAEARKKEPAGARILKAHLEGPFISPKHAGAQDSAFIRPCSAALFDRYYHEAEGAVGEVTFAYEEGDGKGLLARLKALGVTPSVGHSDCSAALFREAIGLGLTTTTHFYNAMRPFHHREVGIIGESFLHDEITCEVIADLIHVSPEAIALLFKVKKKGNIVLITDAIEAKGMKEGVYELGGQKVYLKDGAARLKDGTLAGSVLRLDQALRNVASLAQGYSFGDLIDLVTKNPAKNLGLDKEIGSLEVGKAADLAILDSSFHVKATLVGGCLVYGSLK